MNLLYILKIVGRPWWWILLFLIPCLGFILWIVVAYDLAQAFGYGVGFTLGLIFLSVIFLLILSYGGRRTGERPDRRRTRNRGNELVSSAYNRTPKTSGLACGQR